MHSTSRVTWLVRTSATLAGRLILRLRSTLPLRERKPLRAVQRRTGNDPASRLGRSLSTCRRATHRLVGLGRSPPSFRAEIYCRPDLDSGAVESVVLGRFPECSMSEWSAGKHAGSKAVSDRHAGAEQ